MKPLHAWYRRRHRALPWRDTADPYRIWVSEIMLQQTRVETVLGYYPRFLRRFPNLEALALAPLDDLLKAWEGLGYYARARNLHRAARQVVEEQGGRFPDTLATVEALPGVGRSTAGAIVSIAFGRPHAVLDGNVIRVLVRLDDLREDPARAPVRAALWERAEALVREAPDPGLHNQALMELGATVCLPRRPDCPRCPLRRRCRAKAAGSAEKLPAKTPRGPLPHRVVAVGVVRRGGRLLIQRRPPGGLLGGLWEFPGGTRDPGEELRETVRRELREELGLEVEVGEPIAEVEHAYSHFSITLHAFACRLLAGRPVPRAADAVRWARPAELDRYAFPRATRKVIERL